MAGLLLASKALSAVLVSTISFLFGYLPVLLVRKFGLVTNPKTPEGKKGHGSILAFMLNFGGGVLFANCFIHWMPEVNEGKFKTQSTMQVAFLVYTCKFVSRGLHFSRILQISHEPRTVRAEGTFH